MQELPLTGDIAVLSVELLGLPADPADRFIVATAITHGATLVTADAALLSGGTPSNGRTPLNSNPSLNSPA